jgi:hypothetical protein
MVSIPFFVASGWRAVLAARGIAVIRQVDVRPPAYTRAFVHDRVASPGASTARHLVRRSRKFICDFPWLRLLDAPRFQRDGIIARTRDKAIRHLAFQSWFWAVTVRANWRVIFRFADGRASNLDLIDYP